jgi:hypothetical protein
MPNSRAKFELSNAKITHKLGKDITVVVSQDSKWSQFVGTGNNAIVKTQKADGLNGTVTMRLRGLLRSGGVSGNQNFEENRGKLTYLTQTVELETFGNSIESGEDTKILSQVMFENFREDGTDALTESETDKTDRKMYHRATNEATNVLACGQFGLACDKIETTNYLTVGDVEEAGRMAREGVDSNGKKMPKLRPFKTIVSKDVHGVEIKREIFIMKVGGASAWNLKQDPRWESKQKAASSIGLDSALFTGQLGVIDDVVLLTDGTESDEYAGVCTSSTKNIDTGAALEYYPTGTDGKPTTTSKLFTGKGGIETELNLLLGSSAMLMPQDTGFNYYEEKYDMDRKVRVGIDRHASIKKSKYTGTTAEEKKSVYHNRDYGVIVVAASTTRAKPLEVVTATIVAAAPASE